MPDILNRVTVIQKIQNLIQDDAELGRILIYLENQGPQNSERWNTLLQLSDVTLNRAFNVYVNELLKEAQKKDQTASKLSAKLTAFASSVGLSHAWDCVAEEELANFFRALGTVVSASVAVTSKKPWILLPAMFLSYEVMPSLYEWWYGKTSGKRVAKRIMFSGTMMVCGLGGAVAYSKIGSYYGPVRALIGGVFGSMYGVFCAAYFTCGIYEEIFYETRLIRNEKSVINK